MALSNCIIIIIIILFILREFATSNSLIMKNLFSPKVVIVMKMVQLQKDVTLMESACVNPE